MCQSYFDRFCTLSILTLIVCINSTCSQSKKLEAEGIGEYPFMVAVCQLRNKNTVRLCGGTLIQPQWVLTSQSCKINDYSINNTKEKVDFVVTSLYNLKLLMKAPIRYVKVWIKHPEFGKDKYAVTNDIALLNLDSNYIINHNMQPVVLISKSALYNKELDKEFGYCTFIFWKITRAEENLRLRSLWLVKESKNTTLQPLTVKLIPREKCQTTFAHEIIITHGQFCVQVAKEEPFPIEHSGGPLICQNIQIGLFTWQKVSKNNSAVAVFTRIDSFEEYISNIVTNLKLATRRDFRNIPGLMLRHARRRRRRQCGSSCYINRVLLIIVIIFSIILDI